jgi:thiosulfate/3-mercaptopyruvate sulfurtransferase
VFQTLITVSELKSLQKNTNESGKLVIFDCSYDLSDPHKGLSQYLDCHIANALYANLDTNLSAHDPTLALNGGRHPLPRPEIFAKWLGEVGVKDNSQVVVYDRQGVNFCGRLWWMLKWCGHAKVAILDGGFNAWLAHDGETESGQTPRPLPCTFTLRPPLVEMFSIDQLKQLLEKNPAKNLTSNQTEHQRIQLVDARASQRFNGEVEPLDPIAGHIPGAINRPFNLNLDLSGFFKTPSQLRVEFETLLGDHHGAMVVHQCGSGVSAVANVVAMQIAGYGLTAIYPGSWSEWSRVPGARVEKGEKKG